MKSKLKVGVMYALSIKDQVLIKSCAFILYVAHVKSRLLMDIVKIAVKGTQFPQIKRCVRRFQSLLPRRKKWEDVQLIKKQIVEQMSTAQSFSVMLFVEVAAELV